MNISNPSFDPFAPPFAVGVTSCGAPVWTGYDGAVATTPGSPPVGVIPAYPTFVGNKDVYALVGEIGGKLCTVVDPAYVGAATTTFSSLEDGDVADLPARHKVVKKN